MSEFLTIRVDKSLKEKIRRYKIKASNIARVAIEQEVKKHEIQELEDSIIDMKSLLEKIPDEEIIKTIRESKDQR